MGEARGDLDDFLECCDQQRSFYDQGLISLQIAADNLQWLAERWGLVSLYGQDYVQACIAFSGVNMWTPESVGRDGNCGVAYTPKKIRAAEAIKANPEKSDRAIAEELGIGNKTVSRARNSLVSDDTPEQFDRIGRDGKSYYTPQSAIDAFWHVVRLEDPAYLGRWLANHPLDAPHLHAIWEAKCSTAAA